MLYLPVEVRDLQVTHASYLSSIHGLNLVLEYLGVLAEYLES